MYSANQRAAFIHCLICCVWHIFASSSKLLGHQISKFRWRLVQNSQATKFRNFHACDVMGYVTGQLWPCLKKLTPSLSVAKGHVNPDDLKQNGLV